MSIRSSYQTRIVLRVKDVIRTRASVASIENRSNKAATFFAQSDVIATFAIRKKNRQSLSIFSADKPKSRIVLRTKNKRRTCHSTHPPQNGGLSNRTEIMRKLSDHSRLSVFVVSKCPQVVTPRIDTGMCRLRNSQFVLEWSVSPFYCSLWNVYFF